MYRLNYCQPGALPPFRAFALTAREGLVALPRVSLPSVAGPGLQALPPAEVEGWPSAILNAAYGAYTMETICGTTHCDCLPDSNNFETPPCHVNGHGTTHRAASLLAKPHIHAKRRLEAFVKPCEHGFAFRLFSLYLCIAERERGPSAAPFFGTLGMSIV